ncbi:MAG TPA: hypothetical protein VGP07_20350 [Polyangia bacterium]
MDKPSDGDDPIGQEVRALLSIKIQSIEQLEVVLFLRERLGHAWTPSALAAKLHLTSSEAEGALRQLRSARLVDVVRSDSTTSFRYLPGDSNLSETVERLALEYQQSPLEIVRIISANAIERVRTGTLRFFADSFVLGKKRDG